MIINFGSINIDHVYRVPHFVAPGETLGSTAYSKGLGGKGFNQSIALYRAGADVRHVGCIGVDDAAAGAWLHKQLTGLGLDLSGIQAVETATGHALIQVNDEGENCILLYPGANHELTDAQINAELSNNAAEWVLLQNETNAIDTIIHQAHAAGKKVVFNPAPCRPELAQLPLHKLHTLIVNEIEAQQLSGMNDLQQALDKLSTLCPNIILTLGGDGVRYIGQAGQHTVAAKKVEVVDTTAAGDTFIGYYLASIADGMDVRAALERANAAAAITVTRPGAVSAIPFAHELTN